MTPNIEYMFKRDKFIKDFADKIMPFVKNSGNKLHFIDELKKFYDEAFTEGQTSILNDPNFNKDMKLF